MKDKINGHVIKTKRAKKWFLEARRVVKSQKNRFKGPKNSFRSPLSGKNVTKTIKKGLKIVLEAR